MNQRYGNNDGYRGQPGDETQERGRYSNQGHGRGQEGNYEGDWGRGGGQYGYAEQRGRQFDPMGWGESHPGARRGGEYDDRGSAPLVAGGYGGRGDHYLREWAGRGGQQGYGSQDFGGRQDYPGKSGQDGGGDYGRSYMGSGAHGYGNQGYGNQGHANRNYDTQGYRQQGSGFGGGNQGYEQGRESFGQRHGEGFGQGQEYGEGDSGFSSNRSGQSLGFRGKGPKGYKRSDERLQEDISERLMDDDAIDASEVSVQCKDGMVTLEGAVPERRVKHRIEDLVERCHGVKDIENRITVKRSSRRADSDDEDSGDAGRGETAGNQGQKKKH